MSEITLRVKATGAGRPGRDSLDTMSMDLTGKSSSEIGINPPHGWLLELETLDMDALTLLDRAIEYAHAHGWVAELH